MRIFIYEPSKGWDYCGGAKVVIAQSEKHAEQLIIKHQEDKDQIKYVSYLATISNNKNNKILFENYKNDIRFNQEGSYSWDLAHSFELKGNYTAGVMVDNWNYA